MKEATLKIGRLTESNTIYRADCDFYDVYEADCAYVDNPYCVKFFYDKAYFHTALYAEGLENVVVDFGGATLHLNGFLQPINLFKCKNITLKNVNLEYERGFYSEATVLEVGKSYARVHFSKEFPCRVEDGRLIPYGNMWEDDHLFERQMFFQFFDAATGDGTGISLGIVGPTLPEGQDMCFNPTRYIAEESGDDVIFRLIDENAEMLPCWRVGTILAIEHGGRFYPGVLLQSCKNVTVENVRFINTNSMGILPLHCENVYLRRIRFVRDEKSHGVITNSADAIHAITNSGDFVIEDSIIENMMDDALNVHGQFQLVTACEGNRITVKITSHGITQYCNMADVGDEIALHVENTMVCRSVHHVTAVKILDLYTAELTLDSAPECVKEGDLVENLTGNCNMTIRRTIFGKSNTSLRFQTRGKVLIENCITELPFLLTGDATFWFESSPCTDFTVRNTYFVKPKAIINAFPMVRACEEEPFYHKHITVENCMFTSETPMTLSYTDDIRFISNRNAFDKPMKLLLTNCGTVEAPECEIERETAEQALSSN